MIRRILYIVLLWLAALAAVSAWWLHSPMRLTTGTVMLTVPAGVSPPGVADQAVAAGIQTDPRLLSLMFRLSGQSRLIKAGSYEITTGHTPLDLLDKLVRGQVSLVSVTLVEGWTFAQVRAALAKAQALAPQTANMSDAQIMAQLERPGIHPEGRFFPDTYTYARGSTDLAVLRQAMLSMDRRLTAAWSQRTEGLPLNSPDDMLVLASIVEKETGKPEDRDRIASVFVNRLRIGMMLQTDPTVIYGMGDRFDGNLRKRDLQTDTPYNTYTRAGLPPTPIAMPGAASLLAVAKPATGRLLYFVARGDGSSQFSESLQEHNRAVNRYIRGQVPALARQPAATAP